jgi:hypothetical protein
VSPMLVLLCPGCESVIVFPSGLNETTRPCPNCQCTLTVPTRPLSEEEFERLVQSRKSKTETATVLGEGKGKDPVPPSPSLLDPPTARARCGICSMLEPLGKLHLLSTPQGELLVCLVCINRERDAASDSSGRAAKKRKPS